MAATKASYLTPCPGLGTKTKNHRHSNSCKTLTMISRRKPFDADAFGQPRILRIWNPLRLCLER
jgi:hypothetical protein